VLVAESNRNVATALSFSLIPPASIIKTTITMFLQYSRSLCVKASQLSPFTTPKILGVAPNNQKGSAATTGQTALLSTIPRQRRRQHSNHTGRMQWLTTEDKKRFDRLKAAGLPLNHINQYLAKFKQLERDAMSWSEEETRRASVLKAEGMSDDRIHELLRLQREDALDTQTLGEQPRDPKAKVALVKWAEEDKMAELVKSKWSLMDWNRAQHLKGAGLSPSEIGVCLLIRQAAVATTIPTPWNSHHGRRIVPAIYYDGGGVGGASTASSASSADGGGVDMGGGSGDGFGIDIDIF
jgi:DNA-binding transcriptional MerR regulator